MRPIALIKILRTRLAQHGDVILAGQGTLVSLLDRKLDRSAEDIVLQYNVLLARTSEKGWDVLS